MRFLLVLCLVLAPLSARAQGLTVFAAASLTDAMKDVSALWTKAGHPPLRMSFASSSTLARQIEQGAPANVFASADEKWMDYLAQKNLIVADTRKEPAGQRPRAGGSGQQAAARYDRSELRSAEAARREWPAGGRRSGACAGRHLRGAGAEKAWLVGQRRAPARPCRGRARRRCCWWSAARRRPASSTGPMPRFQRP